jgi:hypothetical protein
VEGRSAYWISAECITGIDAIPHGGRHGRTHTFDRMQHSHATSIGNAPTGPDTPEAGPNRQVVVAGARWSAVDGESGDGGVEVVLGGQGVDPGRVE